MPCGDESPTTEQKQLFDIIVRAGANMKDNHFFQVEFPKHIESEDTIERKYRERVYCYELYHQMRAIVDHDRQLFDFSTKFKLYGEYDKRDYPEDHIKNKIPDFIIHYPGINEKNLAIIEVKPLKKGVGLKKDLETIKAFIGSQKLHYSWGIMYVYGYGADINKLTNRFLELKGGEQKISLIWHEGPSIPPKILSGYNPTFIDP